MTWHLSRENLAKNSPTSRILVLSLTIENQMGRTVTVGKKGASLHSRAAKRATSPGIDLDKSLKNIKPPCCLKKPRPSILEIHQGAGVTKKAKCHRKFVLSAKAKRRHEKELEHAIAVMGRTENKVKRSKIKAKIGHERSLNWDDVNKSVHIQKPKKDTVGTSEIVMFKGDNKDTVSLQQETFAIRNNQDSNEDLAGPIIEGLFSLILPKSGKETTEVDDQSEVIN